MARIGLYPALIVVVFGIVAPFFIFKFGRLIGFAPLLALRVPSTGRHAGSARPATRRSRAGTTTRRSSGSAIMCPISSCAR